VKWFSNKLSKLKPKIMTGKVAKIMPDKPFGFITPEGQTKDLFFHQNSLVGISITDLRAGDMVTFEVEDSPPKPGDTAPRQNAVNVQKA
jgi:CspA family cold shock protein